MSTALTVRERPAHLSQTARRCAPPTARQLAVLRCAAEGLSGRETAHVLGVSEQTVKNHVSRILTQLQVDDRTAAVVRALQEGWLDLSALHVAPSRRARRRDATPTPGAPALAA